MYILQRLNCFEFHNDPSGDEKIQTVFTDQFLTIMKRHSELPLERKPRMFELDRKGLFVDRLDETRAELLVDDNGSSNYLSRELFVLQHSRF